MVQIDMKMPRNCWACPISSDQEHQLTDDISYAVICPFTGQKGLLKKRRKNCPLIEILEEENKEISIVEFVKIKKPRGKGVNLCTQNLKTNIKKLGRKTVL